MAEDDNNVSFESMAEEENNNDDDSGSGGTWIEHFEELCSSEDLTIEELRRMTFGMPPNILENSSFLHRVCMNELVTLEMIIYLVDLYPQAINHCMCILDDYPNVFSAYPLHLAYYNKECPDEVVELLIKKSDDSVFSHICCIDIDWTKSDIYIIEDDEGAGGTPLHYYLSRTSNVKVATIGKMLNRWPYALVSTDQKTKCTPLHIFLHNQLAHLFGVIQYLVGTNPSSLGIVDVHNETPLHIACTNGNIKAGRTISLLLKEYPGSVRQRQVCGWLPIHVLCKRPEGKKEKLIMKDEAAIDVLNLLLKAYPDSVTQADDESEQDHIPLHKAVTNKSPAFCKVLVDAYPESVKRPNNYGCLPFHYACDNGRLDTIEYLFGLYPECLQIRDSNGYLPIHEAANNPEENTAEIVKFLLLHDPECMSKTIVSDGRGNSWKQGNGALPLHVVCSRWDQYKVTELLYDLYPEAVLIRNEQGQLPVDIVREKLDSLPVNGIVYNEKAQHRMQDHISFLQTQMNYARRAQDENAMRRTDSNGSLPLHNAIWIQAPLGAIKLLIKGNTDAVNVPDGRGLLPLDIACQFSTLGVVKYLAKLSPDRLNACDVNKNYPLHHACRGGNCEVISYLLETPMSSASVSEKNVDGGMLPIHLFCEFVNRSEEEEDTPEYTEIIWRLLMAYPETVLNW